MKNRGTNRKKTNKKSGLSSRNQTNSSNSKEYSTIPQERFYKKKEQVTFRFYQVPKALFKNPTYKGLPLGAKLMYSVLRDRLDFSVKNEWEDKNGYIYLVFSLKELLNLLEMDEKTVIKYKKELVKYRLIIDKRVGQGNPNRIYVLKPELNNFQNWKNSSSRTGKKPPLELEKSHPNDTKAKDPNLNNVNRGGSKEAVKKSREEIDEKTEENEEDINDIREKIKESLNGHGKDGGGKSKCSQKEKKVLANHTKPKRKYSKNRSVGKCPKIKKSSSEKGKLLAEEIAEELKDSHSLKAFRMVVDKIPEQRIRIFLSIIKDTFLSGKIRKNRGAMFISLAKEYAAKNNINLNFR